MIYWYFQQVLQPLSLPSASAYEGLLTLLCNTIHCAFVLSVVSVASSVWSKHMRDTPNIEGNLAVYWLVMKARTGPLHLCKDLDPALHIPFWIHIILSSKVRMTDYLTLYLFIYPFEFWARVSFLGVFLDLLMAQVLDEWKLPSGTARV